jgi:hypothetical protein
MAAQTAPSLLRVAVRCHGRIAVLSNPGLGYSLASETSAAAVARATPVQSAMFSVSGVSVAEW